MPQNDYMDQLLLIKKEMLAKSLHKNLISNFALQKKKKERKG